MTIKVLFVCHGNICRSPMAEFFLKDRVQKLGLADKFEIAVPTEETTFDIPEWVGEEVTGDKRYYNSHLCKNPYKNWK